MSGTRVMYELERNIGTGVKFEFAKIRVGAATTCDPDEDEMGAAYERLKAFVDIRVEEEVNGWQQ